ncbi:hypothetical protein SAMN05216464_104254 [Mucilaginibacter pineti]|uniref:Ketosteroid isomerase homolog n=2 Tax=Mucilaginibacter pineti TaxID=1391627 RepID=A0A1G7ATR6_9SPHI|nr:hypothetical protein SAMN05216464_104254 [Mucilaginibacter pineti]
MNMKKLLLAATFISYGTFAFAQTGPAQVKKVVSAEDAFNKLVERKGMKDAFLSVADPEGIVFKPDAVKIVDFYNNIDKQPGKLSWKPNFARISSNGDLAFTAGPYVFSNGKGEDDKVFGDYVSIWRTDADNKFKLLIDLGIQHPESELETPTDFKDAEVATKTAPSKDPFAAKTIIINTDKIFNHSLTLSSLAGYKEFLSPEAHYYFPGFEPMVGSDVIMKFINNQAITITAETTDGGRSSSNDLAYTYGHARITKGNVVSNYNYVRIWELDKTKKWDILLEVFAAIENE